jgi:hypothetical protein
VKSENAFRLFFLKLNEKTAGSVRRPPFKIQDAKTEKQKGN